MGYFNNEGITPKLPELNLLLNIEYGITNINTKVIYYIYNLPNFYGLN